MKADTLFSAQRVRAGLRWQCRGSLWQGDDITLRLRSPQDVPFKQHFFSSVPLQTVWFVCRCLSITHHRTAGCQYWAKFLTSPLLSRCKFSHSVHKLHRMGYSALLAQLAGSAGHCCCTFGSSCWHRHLTLVHAMLFDVHSSGVHIPALLTWPTLSGSMPRLVTSSCLWTH